MSKALVNLLIKLNACGAAREWAETQPSRKAAWESCIRGDWMIWVLGRSTVAEDDPRYRLMGCDFAETALKYVPEGENRPAEAVRIARLFASGEATESELFAARSAAEYAARYAAESVAWSAVWSAARSATWSAVWSAARSAARSAAEYAARSAAEYAARYAAESATWSAVWYAAESAAWSEQADIIRKYFPTCPTIKVPK